MLVLTMSRGNIIDITLEDGRRIEIWALDGDNSHFRLGFNADRSILIDRRAVTERKERERGETDS